ncbi:hypothetical protein [Lewinella sp. 4G2]|uniref:hypothetical protein n=1 Tax=Lewinella sp. 4G2 TaxID=1803372 RepID=UPI0007B4D57A|nr:hypothetical protein [Lewinella sp. 4G2]OAV44452.1 hypothetical protein A3850_008100 [Lewinella sp. 4G2]
MSNEKSKNILYGILAMIAGWIVGSAVNMGLVSLGHSVFPLEGIDLSDMEALAAAMPGMEAKHFLFPFLGHALGTFVGALVAALIARTRKMRYALAIGVLFLIGGIAVNVMLPGPLWFTVVDIVLAYLPMAWLGGTLAIGLRGK